MSELVIADPSPLVLILALTWDFALGEPPAVVHPVVWIGRLTRWLEGLVPNGGRLSQAAFGLFLAIAVPVLFAVGSFTVLWLLRRWPFVLLPLAVFLLKSTFSLRGLREAAFEVREGLLDGGVDVARRSLRNLCSRDPTHLDEAQLVGATVESLAENASDSFVAPLTFYILFGLPGAAFYRAVNTLDAMIGYHGRYEHLGKASARLDDLLNYLPARLTAALLLVAAGLGCGSLHKGWAMLRRDGAKTESPNAGRPMAAMAGVLGVRLDKAGHYALGDAEEPLTPEKIQGAWRTVRLGAIAGAGLAVMALGARLVWSL